MQHTHLPEALALLAKREAQRQRIEESGVIPSQLDILVKEGVVTSHPRVVSGAYVFAGTRVPLYNLWNYLSAGDSLEDFLESFPTVPRELAEKAISLAGKSSECSPCP